VIADDYCSCSHCPLEDIKGVRVLVRIRLGDGADGAVRAEDERERRMRGRRAGKTDNTRGCIAS
jgi:hypothetical protein